MAGEWKNLGPGSFKSDGGTLYTFAVVSRSKSGGNRLPERVRPYRDGEKRDHTGAKGNVFRLKLLFHNDAVSEEGIDAGPQIWPERLNQLEKEFVSAKCGTLNLPWEHNIRCRALDWERSASPELQDGEWLDVTFVTDNEDNLNGTTLENVSVRATIRLKAEDAVFDVERLGSWDGSIEDITELAAGLEAALAAPDEFLQDLEHKAKRLERAVDTVLDALAGKPNGDDPAQARQGQTLREARELAAKALVQSTSSLPRIVSVVFDNPIDVFAVATELEQSAEELMRINPQIPDLAFIPARTPIKVFQE